MTNLADELERLALQEGFSIVDLDLFVQANLPAILSALRGEEWQGIETGKVYVTVSGRTGTGKSAVLGEIEIAMRALGLTVETDHALQSEKNMTGADWLTALELYKPVVVLREVNLPPPPKGTTHE